MTVALAAALQQPLLTVRADPAVIGSVPIGAQRVTMLTLTLSASCMVDIPIATVALMHEGAGSAADVLRVYAFEGQHRVSRAATPQARDGRTTVRLRSLVIPRCKSRRLSFTADLSSDAASGGEHRFVLRSAHDVNTVSPDVRILMELSPPASPALPLPARAIGPQQGTISVTYLTVPQPITYGDNRRMLRLRLTADSKDDHVVTALTLTNEGKARDSDLQNLFLAFSDGKPLTPLLSQLNGASARFTFEPPLYLDRNADRILVLHANVRAGRRETLEFVVQEPGDIEATVVRGRQQ